MGSTSSHKLKLARCYWEVERWGRLARDLSWCVTRCKYKFIWTGISGYNDFVSTQVKVIPFLKEDGSIFITLLDELAQ